ncbi:hypothetical protein RQP46_006293 [Phenoliferia psychrophenolica]
MRFTFGSASAVLSLLSFAIAAPNTGSSQLYPVSDPRSCGTVEIWDEAVEELIRPRVAAIQASRASGLQKRASKNVPVYFHAITKGTAVSDGVLSAAAISGQMKALNDQYAGFGYSFTLAATTTTLNADWFSNAGPSTSQQDAMKAALRKGGANALNFYSVGFESGSGQGLLGYATFPSSYSSAPYDDGVVFLFSSVPGRLGPLISKAWQLTVKLEGGATANYDQGKTATHEAGHWLGLYHTFQGGCFGSGDGVADTAPELTSASGCPTGRDTCLGGGVDPITNYMDYSYDACMTGFTAGQADRMSAMTAQYRGL